MKKQIKLIMIIITGFILVGCFGGHDEVDRDLERQKRPNVKTVANIT